jgi:hypothetical protein
MASAYPKALPAVAPPKASTVMQVERTKKVEDPSPPTSSLKDPRGTEKRFGGQPSPAGGYSCIGCDENVAGSPAGYCLDVGCSSDGVKEHSYLCKDCLSAHRTKKALKSHAFSALGERNARVEAIESLGQPIPGPCPRHSGRALEYVCLGCDGCPPLCTSCIPEHPGCVRACG